MKQKIMVVLCASSALNYIQDIRNAGYEPVILEPFVPETRRDEARKVFDAEYARLAGERPAIFAAKESYEDTLAMVREINPCVILPGTDYALELATNLAYDLGLPGNPPERLPYLREKDMMHEAVKAAGLRYIRGKVVSTVEEAVRYFREDLKSKPAIVKPLRGAGSAGVIACLDEEELAKAVSDDIELARKKDAPTIAVLIQEMIVGTEYFVNTVTLDGHTVVTNVMCYEKRRIAAERPVYVRGTALDSTDPIYGTITDYVVKVINAVGLKIGPMHTEVMVDECGPVLIEVNARLAGADQPAEWQDKVMGLHESDIALRAYLGKNIFHNSYDGYTSVPVKNGNFSYYNRLRPGCFQCAVTTKDIEAEEFIGQQTIMGLSSVHSFLGFEAPRSYPATRDYFTFVGTVYMVNDSEKRLDEDFYNLLDIEMNHIEKLFRLK